MDVQFLSYVTCALVKIFKVLGAGGSRRLIAGSCDRGSTSYLTLVVLVALEVLQLHCLI